MDMCIEMRYDMDTNEHMRNEAAHMAHQFNDVL
jgi:hypothetical protein